MNPVSILCSFPNSRTDSILQISSIAAIATSEDYDEIQQFIFTLDTCAAINHVKVIECITERSLLKKWRQFFLEFDPVVITGYYLKKFDLKYLIQQAERMNLPDFPLLGRVPCNYYKVYVMIKFFVYYITPLPMMKGSVPWRAWNIYLGG
ncbi:DNA polymerase family B, exonuclease domain-containing protein [Phascolomyces articulosus]|uniref:DNA polymerase delta catalytic subunit n=1 Tax=Phascolomyces articulosus TaxID=60185 RepID=A0AAD5PIZ2_9FUNG|nr:DNA polymerase family B, exonuclease domain-containing protein [Phascolomyces articulosus]